MKIIILSTLVFLFVFSCVNSFAEEHSHYESSFNLTLNQTVDFDSGNFKVTLESISEDSRCPSDVTCVWEGRFTGEFLLVSKNFSESTTLSSNSEKLVWNGYTVKINDVSPYPSSDKKISPDEYVVSLIIEKSRYDSPLKQTKSGIESTKVMCNVGLDAIMKKNTGQIVCVKPSSIEKLLQRNWAIHILPDYQKNDNNNSEIFSTGSYIVENETVNYFDNVNGYLVKPVSKENFPQIIMIHEWWGLNDNIKDMANKLASHGYVVLAVDLYGGKVATTAEEARTLMTSFDKQTGIDNMNSAFTYLHDNYGENKIGSIGWCFGGGQSLNLALSNSNMDATVMYYGQLVTDQAELSKIKWPVLGIFAANDKGIPVNSVKQFESNLNTLNIPNDIIIYPNVDHAFANPSGNSYSKDASQDAWKKTLSFLDSELK